MLEGLNLEARRGRRVLFSGLAFAAQAGQLVRVAGANGSGKTTLLRMVVGLTTPDAGGVHWCGRRITDQRDEFHAQLVYIGHAAALKDDLSAVENLHAMVALGGDRSGAAEATQALAQAGLKGRERLPARVLSQGQRRRVALARLALASHRGLWVLDEPFNALDSAATEWLSGLIRQRLQGGGIVLLTSHQAVPVDGVADQVTVAL